MAIKREVAVLDVDGTPAEVAPWGVTFEAEVAVWINGEHYVGLSVDEAETFLVEFQNALSKAKEPERALEIEGAIIGGGLSTDGIPESEAGAVESTKNEAVING